MAFPPTSSSSEEPNRIPDPTPPGTPIPAPVVVSQSDDVPGVDAWAAEPPPDGQIAKRASRLGLELVQTLVLAALISFLVRTVAQNFRVEGSSMEPGLHNSEYLLVNKAVYFRLNAHTFTKYIPFLHTKDTNGSYLFRTPHRGDVIVFRYPQDPSRDFIKRVIGLPGDHVRMDYGVVSVNGVPLDEPYILDQMRGVYPETVVPPHSYFVLGDNRGNSSDSRAWGFVPEQNIIGQAMFSYWPLHSFGGVGNKSIHLGFVSIPLP